MARGRHRKDPGLLAYLIVPLLGLILVAGSASAAIMTSMSFTGHPHAAAARNVPSSALEQPDRLRLLRPAPASPQPVTVSVRTYKVKSGDSLWTVAAKLLGSGMKWGQLASLNHIAAPYVLTTGQVLRL